MSGLNVGVEFAKGWLGQAVGIVEAYKQNEETSNAVLDDAHVLRIELAYSSMESTEAHNRANDNYQLNRTKNVEEFLRSKIDS